MISRDSLSLFGIDLAGIYEFWRDGLSEAAESGWFRWVLRPEPMRVVDPDGQISVRAGMDGRGTADTSATSLTAVVLPEDLYLAKVLEFPQLTSRQLASAVALQAEQLSPFDAGDLVWGWRREWRQGAVEGLSLVIASRAAVETHVQAMLGEGPEKVEVWSGGGRPVLIAGFGEVRRRRREHGRAWQAVLAVVFGIVLLLAMAMVPVRQAEQRLEAAEARLSVVRDEAKPAIAIREKLEASAAALDRLRAHNLSGASELEVLDALTALVPDDAMLFRFELKGSQLRLSGQADDASRVLQRLSDSKAFAAVRSTGPFSRASNGRESFMFEVILRDEEQPA